MDIEENDEDMRKSVEECRKRLLLLLALGAVAIGAQEEQQQDDGEGPDIFWVNDVVDHRSNPRGRRRAFDSQGAYDNIIRDHLGPDPLFRAEDILLFFRMSRPRIEVIIQTIAGNSGNPFYVTFRSDSRGKRGASIETKILITIVRTLAYGVASYCFCDYYSMSDNVEDKRVGVLQVLQEQDHSSTFW
jgi:hypothetical protein